MIVRDMGVSIVIAVLLLGGFILGVRGEAQHQSNKYHNLETRKSGEESLKRLKLKQEIYVDRILERFNSQEERLRWLERYLIKEGNR